MEFLYFFRYVCLRLRFLDVETNDGQRSPVLCIFWGIFASVFFMRNTFWGVCSVRQILYVFSLYRNFYLDDRICVLFTNITGCRAG